MFSNINRVPLITKKNSPFYFKFKEKLNNTLLSAQLQYKRNQAKKPRKMYRKYT